MIQFIRHSGKSKTTGTEIRSMAARAWGGRRGCTTKGHYTFRVLELFSILIFGGGYKTMHLSKFIDFIVCKL